MRDIPVTGVFAATLLIAAIAGSLMMMATAARAADPEVEVICWDDVNGKLQCETVGDLKAECAVTDPENTGEQCQAAASASLGKPVRNLGKMTKRNGKSVLMIRK